MPMIISPDQYASASTYELLEAVALGHARPDHRLLRVFLDRGEAVLPDLLRFFNEQDEIEDYRFDEDEFFLDIARALRSPAALPFLFEYASQYEEFTEGLILAFAEIGPPAIEPLLEFRERNPRTSSDVCFALASMGVRDERILKLLVKELETDPSGAAICLGLYGDPAAKPALETALAQATDERTRLDIASAIEDLDAGRRAELEPFDVWEDYPEEDEPEFAELSHDELLEFLASPVARYRARAVRMLGFDGVPQKTVPRILELAKTDPDVEVRAEAWEALDTGIEEPGVREAMESRLHDASAPAVERAAIAVALAVEGGREEPLHGIIRQLYGVPEARARAIRAMRFSLDRRFSDYIPRHFDDSDFEVRKEAVLAAGWLGIVSQLRRIEQFFEDPEMRDSALYAYSVAAPGDVTPAHARRLFRKIETLAGGLLPAEASVVRRGLDDRLQLHGQEPIFQDDDSWEEEDEEEREGEEFEQAAPAKVGRNDPCPCGSGKKYKKCCGQ